MPFFSHAKIAFSFFAGFFRPQLSIAEHIGLYLCNTIRAFAGSLVGIFIPIYIFEISTNFMIFSPDPVKNGIFWVLGYFLLRSIFALLGVFSLIHFIFTKLGLGRSIMVSLILLILEMAFWILSGYNLFFMLLAGALAGLVVTTYWIPYHVFFVEKFKDYSPNYGKSTATASILTRLASGLGPAIGGVMIAAFGFRALFSMSILLLVVAGLPALLIIRDWKHRDHFVSKIIKKARKTPRFKWMGIGFIGEGLDVSIYSVLWPLALFFALESFVTIGTLNAISFFISITVAVFVGKLIDKRGIKLIHIIGILINASLYIPRALLFGPGVYYAVDILDKANSPFFSLPNVAVSYRFARKYGRSDSIIFRELMLHTGFIIGILVAATALVFVSDWKMLFVIPAIGTLLTMFYEKR